MLHGWGANIELFSGIINLVSSKYETIAIDMPGFGGTEEPKEPWCVDDYVDFILAFIKQFGLQNIILLGHSFGCRVIIKMVSCRNLPFDVDKIIIVDGAGIRPVQTPMSKMRNRVFKVGKWIYSINIMKKLFPKGLDEWRKKFGSADYNNASPIMRQTLIRVVSEDLTEFLSSVTPETLLIWGENDTATPVDHGKMMERMMPNAGLAIIKNAGHFSFLEQQQVFNSILASYLIL
jgi:Predicted hydrolases or acyltransferases (alpha/beta hydrolase superfamily)